MAANPRIDELRKRLEKAPDSRLFAQLAEELRKAGELVEAIRVSRDGLTRHTNYPSARMTLGRALLDSGDLPAARLEFAAVLKGAPDNILAGRFLGECLEGLEDHEAALAQYRRTLVLAPGESHLTDRIAALEQRLAKAQSGSDPIRVAAAEEEFEVEKPFESPPTEISEKPPARTPLSMAVPVIQVEEDFELERPVPGGMEIGSPAPETAAVPESPPAAAAKRPSPGSGPVPIVEAEDSFELEEAYASPPTKISEAPPPRSLESRAIPLLQVQEAMELARPEPGVGVTPDAGPKPETGAPASDGRRPGTAPIPIVEAEASFEIEEAYASPPTKISEAPPPSSPESQAIPLAQIQEAVELTRPEAGVGAAAAPEEPAAPKVEAAPKRSPEAEAVPVAPIEENFELERPGGPEAVASEDHAPPAEAPPPGSPEAGLAEPTAAAPAMPEAARAEAPSLEARPPAKGSPAFGSETVAVPAAMPMPRRAPARMPPKSRVAEISPEHAAAAMGDLAGLGKTTPLTSGTLAELYVSQGVPQKAIEIYEKLVVDTPGDERAKARLAELRAGAEPPAPANPRAARRAAIQRSIGRLEAFLAAVKERKVSP